MKGADTDHALWDKPTAQVWRASLFGMDYSNTSLASMCKGAWGKTALQDGSSSKITWRDDSWKLLFVLNVWQQFPCANEACVSNSSAKENI